MSRQRKFLVTAALSGLLGLMAGATVNPSSAAASSCEQDACSTTFDGLCYSATNWTGCDVIEPGVCETYDCAIKVD